MIGLALLSLTFAVGIFMENTAPRVSGAENTPSEFVGRAPVLLRIPAIGVLAHVQWVGVKSDGTMANPKGFADVGWFRDGAKPGERGSAVLAGHLDNGLGQKAVFFDLEKLLPDDTVIVQNDAGEELTFRVLRTRVYNVADAPVHEIFNRDDGIYLNLITCDGAWDKNKKSYDKRLVVYTQLITSN